MEWLTVPEAAHYLSSHGEPVSEGDVLRLVQEGVLKISVRFLDRIYGQHAGLYSESEEPVRDLLPDGEVFDLPMVGAARLAVEAAYRRVTGKPDALLSHRDAIVVVDDTWDDRYELYHRAGDYSPVTRLPEHAVLLLRREVLDQFAGDLAGDRRSKQGSAHGSARRCTR
jgi:hypothetical protein